MRTFGAAPEFIFSLGESGAPAHVFVNLYEPATLTTQATDGTPVTVTVSTNWPFDTRVDVLVSSDSTGGPRSGTLLTVALRMPAWAQPASGIPILVDGTAQSTGAPGSYALIDLSLPASGSAVNVSFPLVAAPVAIPYTGVTQIAPWSRYAYTFGPFVLAAVGGWDTALNCGVINGSTVSGFDPLKPEVWLNAPPGTPAGALPALNAGGDFTIQGVPAVVLRPYFRVDDEAFTVFPIVVPA